ncbi:MAG: CarboxypepD reg-like domain, partial [Acidobacteriota bacterium]|nr:CarboxypepD reg-like domain [Acidobacteriota bacterium]
MNLTYRKIAIALFAILLALPVFAAKRRAAGHPANTASDATLRGTVLDNVTGQPVTGATVTVQGLSNKTDTTDVAGHFEIKHLPFGVYTLSFTRTGYEPKSAGITATANSSTPIETRLTPKPVVLVKMTNGSTVQIDTETVEFAYMVPFSGYARSEYARFCLPGTGEFQPDRSEIKKISGPIVPGTNASCCKDGNPLKATVQLRNGQTSEVFFIDSCVGYEVNFIGRDHVSGQFVFLKFNE